MTGPIGREAYNHWVVRELKSGRLRGKGRRPYFLFDPYLQHLSVWRPTVTTDSFQSARYIQRLGSWRNNEVSALWWAALREGAASLFASFPKDRMLASIRLAETTERSSALSGRLPGSGRPCLLVRHPILPLPVTKDSSHSLRLGQSFSAEEQHLGSCCTGRSSRRGRPLLLSHPHHPLKTL